MHTFTHTHTHTHTHREDDWWHSEPSSANGTNFHTRILPLPLSANFPRFRNCTVLRVGVGASVYKMCPQGGSARNNDAPALRDDTSALRVDTSCSASSAFSLRLSICLSRTCAGLTALIAAQDSDRVTSKIASLLGCFPLNLLSVLGRWVLVSLAVEVSPWLSAAPTPVGCLLLSGGPLSSGLVGAPASAPMSLRCTLFGSMFAELSESRYATAASLRRWGVRLGKRRWLWAPRIKATTAASDSRMLLPPSRVEWPVTPELVCDPPLLSALSHTLSEVKGSAPGTALSRSASSPLARAASLTAKPLMRAHVLTESPKRRYRSSVRPATPAMRGPQCMPIATCTCAPPDHSTPTSARRIRVATPSTTSTLLSAVTGAPEEMTSGVRTHTHTHTHGVRAFARARVRAV